MTKRLALCFGTRDRIALSERSIEPLLHPDIDLTVVDGSTTTGAIYWAEKQVVKHDVHLHANVRGGADRWIVYGLATALENTDAPYVGICENDVLLHPDWLGPTLALFERGAHDGLEVGAVSARAYTDRILCQRDGYALMHNLGAGHLILTREAARIALNTCRTTWTTENRKVFHQLCGLDIARWWAFRGNPHMITLDWGIERCLAAHGLASLALTPSPCEMIGQDPPLSEQGLTLATEPVELLRNDDAFMSFAGRTALIRDNHRRLPSQLFCRPDDGSQIIFPHQLGALGGEATGEWRLKWQQGFGPFAFIVDPASEQVPPIVEVPIAGPCSFFVSGGPKGGRVRVNDTLTGYEVEPYLEPEGQNSQMMQLVVPGNVAYRTVRLTAISPGVTFYGLSVTEPQPTDPTWTFDHAGLPKP